VQNAKIHVRKGERERERKKTVASYSMHAAQSKIIHGYIYNWYIWVFVLRARYCNGVFDPDASLPQDRGHVGTCRQSRGKFRRDLTIIRYVTRDRFCSPSGEWRVCVFRWTPINSSASELWFVNQFCASTIKARTSMLHLPVLVPFTNRMSICALIVA